MNRREFLIATYLGFAGLAFDRTSSQGASSSKKTAGASGIKYIRNTIPPVHIPPYKGRHYEANVPDTLDVAERARIVVEGALTRGCDPDHDFETYQEADFSCQPAFMYHSFHDFNGSQPKYLEALPLLRSITGTDVNMHVDKRLFEVLQQMIGDDGLTWVPVKGRPWALFDCWSSVLRKPNLPPNDVEHIFSLWPHGRSILTMCLWQMRDPENPFIKGLLEKMAHGTGTIAIDKGDFDYFPCELLYRTPEGTLAAGGTFSGQASAPVPLDQALDKSARDSFQLSTARCCDAGPTLQGLVRLFRMTGDERVGKQAGRLARYVRHAVAEDGSFEFGNLHNMLFGVTGLLDYADYVGDKELKQLSRSVFEYCRAGGVPVLGFYPHFSERGVTDKTHLECCNTADMMTVAIKLTEYGIRDCWEDIDQCVRNHFFEMQLTEVDWLYKNSPERHAKKQMIGNYESSQSPVSDLLPVPGFFVDKEIPERLRGAFATSATVNDWSASPVSGCCIGNASRAIYYIWRSILNCEHNILKVNLLLNRTSPWADVNSYIPYTGQVDIHIKKSVQLQVRVPEWVDKHTVRLQVNGKDRRFGWMGRYLDAGHVEQGQKVTVTFPIAERTVTIEGPFGAVPKITVVLRGNDVVDISPKGTDCPIYQRAHYRSGEVRWKKVTRFEPAEIIRV